MRTALAGLLVLGAAGVARAQDIDMSKGGPIDVTSRDGMEWRQNEMEVIARGDARAVRGNVTVVADVLIARYRKKAQPAGAAPAPGKAAGASGATPVSAQGAAPGAPGSSVPGSGAPGSGAPGSGSDTGANEIYRLEAIGNVKIFTATDLAVGDHAIYDIDQAVLLMTGNDLKITTPQQVLTARDTMEYWSQKHMSVGRGLATVVTNDGRRVSGDVLVGFTEPPAGSGPAAAGGGAPSPAPKAAPAPGANPAKPGDALDASGKLQRVEGFGHVEVRTATETITGDRGVYVSESGIARIAGTVHITRGQNELQGDEALVNMKTGISTLIRDPGRRVQGLVMPNDAATKDAVGGPGKGAAPAKDANGGRSSTPARTP